MIYNKNNEEIVTRKLKAINIDNTITAENFKYNKNSNILNAKNKVTIFDNLNDVVIKSNDITYNKNEESVFSKGLTTSVIEKKYHFKSQDIFYDKEKSILAQIIKHINDDNKINMN